MIQIKSLITASICYIMSIDMLSAQCDNPIMFAPNSNIACGANTLTAGIYAGEFNISTGYLDQATLVYTSSVATDYITIRMTSTNDEVAHGASPLTVTYLASYGDLEVHINTNAACGTESVARNITCVMTCRCNNSNQYPSNTVNISCGINSVVPDIYAGEHTLTTGYLDQSTLVFSSSVSSDFITIRKASDNAVIAFGPSPLTTIYDTGHGNLEVHINTNLDCGTQDVSRNINCVMTCGCNNTVVFPNNIISIIEGTNIITTQQWAGDYNITSGYIDGAVIKYSSSVLGDFITLRRASDNFIITTGATPLDITYEANMGNIEMHVNTNAACGTQNTNRTTTVNMYNIYKGGMDDGFAINGVSEPDNPLLTNMFRGGIDDGFATISYEQCSGNNRRWLGTSTDSWHLVGNWECSLLPNSASDVDIPSGLTLYPQVSSDVTINSLKLYPGTALNVHAPSVLRLLGL